jgi:hypothetical protein
MSFLKNRLNVYKEVIITLSSLICAVYLLTILALSVRSCLTSVSALLSAARRELKQTHTHLSNMLSLIYVQHFLKSTKKQKMLQNGHVGKYERVLGKCG